jgi:hypothetical protein
MRAVSMKAAAVAALTAAALAFGAGASQAADVTHVTKTSARGKAVSVTLPSFRGGTLSVSVDATGTATEKHTLTLSVAGKKLTTKSYTDKDTKKTFVVADIPAGDVQLAAPASAGQLTTVAIDVQAQNKKK